MNVFTDWFGKYHKYDNVDTILTLSLDKLLAIEPKDIGFYKLEQVIARLNELQVESYETGQPKPIRDTLKKKIRILQLKIFEKSTGKKDGGPVVSAEVSAEVARIIEAAERKAADELDLYMNAAEVDARMPNVPKGVPGGGKRSRVKKSRVKRSVRRVLA